MKTIDDWKKSRTTSVGQVCENNYVKLKKRTESLLQFIQDPPEDGLTIVVDLKLAQTQCPNCESQWLQP